jgi:hypothetical protein
LIQVSSDGGSNWVDATTISTTWIANGVTLVSGVGTTLTTRTIDLAGNFTVGASHGYVLDTAADAVSIALASDTGHPDDLGYDTDGITSDGTVNVLGLEVGATWEYVTDGSTNWIDGSGNSFELSEDSYASGDIKVRQTDLAGNTSAVASNSGGITVDSTAPLAPVFALDDDTGINGSDGVTNSGLVTVSDTEATVTLEYSTDGGANWQTIASGVSFTLGQRPARRRQRSGQPAGRSRQRHLPRR